MSENWKSYVKVITVGILSITAISGLYSLLSNVQSLEVMPDFWDGIICYANSTKFDDYCDFIAAVMSNSTNTTIIVNVTNFTTYFTTTSSFPQEMYPTLPSGSLAAQWKCSSHTDYSSRGLYDTFSSAKNYLIVLIVFATIYGVSAIVHDITLIYYKNNLDVVSFHPSGYQDFYLSSRSYKCFKIICGKSTCVDYISMFFIALFTSAIDLAFMLVLYPITSSIASLFGIKRLPHHVNALSYLSASWVGISRCFMIMATFVMLEWTSDGFEKEIPSLAPNICYCECNYVLTESDFYKMFFVTLVFIGLNVRGLWSWIHETIYNQHYLYLISYTLPVVFANQINSKDCAGSMMQPINSQHKGDSPRKTTVILSTASPKVQKQELKDMYSLLEDDDEDEHDQNEDVALVPNKLISMFLFRLVVFYISMLYYMPAGLIFLYGCVSYNYYQYSDNVITILYVIIFIGILVSTITVVFTMRHLFNQYKRKRGIVQ